MTEQLPDVPTRTSLFRSIDEHEGGWLKGHLLRIAGTLAITILAFAVLYIAAAFSD